MTILELIKAQCKVQGVPENHAERIEKISGITEEKDGNIAAAVKSFKENVLPAIQEAEKTKDEAVKQAIADYEKKHNLKDGKPIEQPKKASAEVNENGKEETGEIAELKKMMQELLSKQKSSETLEVVKLKLKGKIDDKFIDKYANRVKLDSDNIDAEIESVIKEFNEDKQAFLNDAVVSGNYQPIEGGIAGDKSVDEWAKIMNGRQNKGENAGVVDLGLK